MEKTDGFELKNLGNDYFYSYNAQEVKSARSTKKKLFIVFSFIVFLLITPAVIFGLSSINFNKAKKISIAKDPIFENKKTVNQNTKNSEPESVSVEVLNNDSYWKITKRICGSGKLYLSVRDQNGGKALHKGDFIKVNCVL